MKISVVMATYNGQKHLQEQIDSIVKQTTLPDECVISDDGSTDQTIQILNGFARNAPFPVVILTRDAPLGFAKNFATACLHASGDVVILSDQDDSWSPQKIQEIKAFFIANPEKELALHDIAICDSELRPLIDSYFSYLRSQGHDPAYLVKGCATAVKRSLLSRAYPLPENGRWTHDCRLHALASMSGTRGMIHNVLCRYRVHGSNTSGYVLPKNNWKGAISARLKRGSLKRASWAYKVLQYSSLRDISEVELREIYLAHSDFRGDVSGSRGGCVLRSFDQMKAANACLNYRSEVARRGSRLDRLIAYIRYALQGGYVDSGGVYALFGDFAAVFASGTRR